MPVEVSLDPHGVATVVINRAAKLNTLDPKTMDSFTTVLEQVATDQNLRAIILRGAGDKAFIGGADINTMAQLSATTARDFITQVHRCCDAVRRAPVPVIARIHGYTLGAGLEVAAACDIRIAAETSVFGMPEVQVGIPSVVEAALLPQLIGWGRTRWLLLTGQTIDAQCALQWGLVEQITPAAQLDQAVTTILESILSAGPWAVRIQKSLISDWETLPLAAAIERGIQRFTEAYTTDEPKRMMRAFLDRRRN